ncbi:ABC transporter permease [Bacillus suaedae]|uniref:ABC transporter permease n=1 Tax=Halalkalibacter suaedae TaxID=2822140 RepID=A0A941AMK0_9BACI|nr:FtsX-like permease family protein [Bacillus suaedae]MBP3949946.1 ABC transporter permease [Bacillus suaedae]
MQFKDQLAYIKRNMKKNRLRVAMTILATTMGCAFLIVLASVGFGLQGSITEQMTKNQIINEISIWGREVEGESKEIEASDIEKLKELDGVEAVVTRTHSPYILTATLDEYAGEGNVVVTDFEQEQKANYQLDQGRFPNKSNEIIVGFHTKEMLLKQNSEEATEYEGSLLGQNIQLEISEEEEGFEDTFVIVGIGKEPAQDWLQDSTIFVSDMYERKSEILTFEGEEIQSSNISIYATDVQDVEGLTNELKTQGYWVDSISERVDGMKLFFTALKVGLVIVGTVAVMIASIGIFNTMTMAVTERTQEIGIMKAIGANPAIIRRLFLMESAAIGIIGVILGVAISYLISFAANELIPLILAKVTETEEFMDITFSSIPLELLATASIISISVAMLSGLRPARNATKINVLSALRREM